MRFGAAAKVVIFIALLACVLGQDDDDSSRNDRGRGNGGRSSGGDDDEYVYFSNDYQNADYYGGGYYGASYDYDLVDDDNQAGGVFIQGVQYNVPECEEICQDPNEFETPLPLQPMFELNRAHDWGIVLLNQIMQNFDRLTPPGVGRVIGVFSSCVYDAVAVQGDFGMTPAISRQGPAQPGLPVDRVIDGAAFTAVRTAFGNDPSFPLAQQFLDSVSPSASGQQSFAPGQGRRRGRGRRGGGPAGADGSDPGFVLGSQVCQEVIQVFTSDGAEVDGDPLPGNNFPLFTPANAPQTTAGIADCQAEIVSLDFWQPLCVPDFEEAGRVGSQECTVQEFASPDAPFWTTFALPSGDAVRPEGPPTFSQDTDEYLRQAREIVEFSTNLGDVPKMLAEFWADGPDTTAPPGHWYRITLDSAVRERLSLEDTVRLMFLMGNALNDAGVASWDAKVFFNSARPITMIQCGLAGETLDAWIGPYQGVGDIEASVWQPYQAATFVSPNFAGYVSGHSTFSAAAYHALELFYGDEEYLAPKCRLIREGTSIYEGRIDAGEPGFIAGLTDVPNQGARSIGYSPATNVVLCWETWEDSGLESGISRFPGGIHIVEDHVDGVDMGREIAELVYDRAEALWSQ